MRWGKTEEEHKEVEDWSEMSKERRNTRRWRTGVRGGKRGNTRREGFRWRRL